ncbi:hypothetical protein ACTJIJ_19620 [Niabella sp. 22666]|uniref:hypothetical protein n=1 Tax=Niabella sp. 22666 TaxID=3453954 RepID=UPI003F82F4D9
MKPLDTKRFFIPVFALGILLLSCNKDVEQYPDNGAPSPGSQPAIAASIAANANYSLYNAIIAKSGLASKLSDSTIKLTAFVPGNAAVKQAINLLTSGAIPVAAPDATFLGFIGSENFTSVTAQGIVGYNTVPQTITFGSLPGSFPNFQYPTLINPAETISALLRLTTFPSNRNGNFVNNVPVVNTSGTPAGNGMIYETGAVVTPPKRFLWDRINTDDGLTYLKAAVARADSGTAAPGFLTGVLQNIGANLTVFAPTDDAFKATLYSLAFPSVRATIFAQAKAAGASDAVANAAADANAPAQTTALVGSTAVFSNPLLFPVLTAERVKGVVVYHILGNRAFLNNFATTQTNVPTLLNGAVPAHPGVGLQATLTGPMVTAASVKGAVNATAATITINPTPEPGGSSDQHYVNGVIHKINQVLLPQSF